MIVMTEAPTISAAYCAAGHGAAQGFQSVVDKPRGAKPMTVAELINTLEALPLEAPVALRTILPNQRVRWDDIERVELRAPQQLPPVVLIR